MSTNNAKRLRTLRRLVQLFTLGLFLYLFFETAKQPVNLFLHLDPLLALSSMLAARRWLLEFAPAIIVVLVTLAMGRVWCGWICPLGTILDLGSRARRSVPQRFRQAKYFLLFVILFAAVLSNLTFIFLDPLSLLTHASSALDSISKPTITAIFALIFAAVLATNLLAKRFWCRYLCPLGALLGLLARLAWRKRRVNERCNRCGLCARECSMVAVDARRDFASDEGECILCLNCLARCPREAIGFEGGLGPGRGRAYDPSRRQLLASLGASVVGVSILRTVAAQGHPPLLLRPPGAREVQLLARCIRCSRCIKACPTSALQPSLLESGWEGLWTPMLVPRVGYCAYSCTACGQVCPSGAIPPLPLAVKRVKVIGTAHVDQARCISCMVCEELCPVPGKAIRVQEVRNEIGEMIEFPYVVWDLCTGCGICEYVCPVPGEAAIRVRAPAIL